MAGPSDGLESHAVNAVQALRARGAGVTISLSHGAAWTWWLRPRHRRALKLLADHKAEIVALLAGEACRVCGQPIAWPRLGAGLTYADGTSECMACADKEVGRLLAAGSRAAESPDALADPAEVMLRGELE